MFNLKIDKVTGRQIIDSRGNPTVEAEVLLSDGTIGRGASPSGASTGEFEALELRDNDPQQFGGKGVTKAVANINEKIAPALVGLDPTDQYAVDAAMLALDGTEDKSNLGANAMMVRRTSRTSVPMPYWPSRWLWPMRQPRRSMYHFTVIWAARMPIPCRCR